MRASSASAFLWCGVLLGCGGPPGPNSPEKCRASVETMVRTPPTPPAHTLGGVWRCRYNTPDGKAITEKLTFSITGNKVTVSGTNNYGENVVADGTAGGTEIGLRETDLAGRHLRLTGAMLDGHVRYFIWDRCYEARLTCTRS